MIEEFRDILGYEGKYQVSNYGRVKSLSRISEQGHKLSEKILKNRIRKDGYVDIGLFKDNKKYYYQAHKLVAMSFLNHTPNGTQNLVVNHKDENKLNNFVDNLEIITNRANVIYSIDKNKTSSKYTGVNWKKSCNKWVTTIRIGGNKKKHLGLFKCELKAAYTYNMYLKELLKK